MKRIYLIGALVLFLTGNASAIEYNVKRFTLIEMFKNMSDEQATQFLRAADNGGAGQTMSIRVPVFTTSSRDVVIDLNEATNIWQYMIAKYTNANISQWKEWQEQKKPKFGDFGYTKGGTFVDDGFCYVTPGAQYGGVNINTTATLGRMEFASYSLDLGWTFKYDARVRVGGQQWSGGESYTKNLQKEGFVDICFRGLQFSSYPFSPLIDALHTNSGSAQKFLGDALRGVAQDYYDEEPQPYYGGYTITGILETDLQAECTAATCPGWTAPGGSTGGGSTPPATGGGSSSPACTTSTGATSGNPYDCAPNDTETSCSIINLPCNFKKLFIPREDFIMTELPKAITYSFAMPTQITDKISVTVPLMGKNVEMGLDFTGLMMNDTFKSIIKLMAGVATILWLINFIGLPNPFGGSLKGNDNVGQVHQQIKESRRTKGRK